MNRDELVSRLLTILTREPDKTLGQFAEEIGIYSMTLRSFIEKKCKPEFGTYLKILKYVNDQEQNKTEVT